MNKKEWDNLVWKKLYKPCLLIGSIPFGIALIVSLIFVGINFSISMMILGISTMYVLFIIVIGLGAGGLDFVNKYGYRDEQKE